MQKLTKSLHKDLEQSMSAADSSDDYTTLFKKQELQRLRSTPAAAGAGAEEGGASGAVAGSVGARRGTQAAGVVVEQLEGQGLAGVGGGVRGQASEPAQVLPSSLEVLPISLDLAASAASKATVESREGGGDAGTAAGGEAAAVPVVEDPYERSSTVYEPSAPLTPGTPQYPTFPPLATLPKTYEEGVGLVSSSGGGVDGVLVRAAADVDHVTDLVSAGVHIDVDQALSNLIASTDPARSTNGSSGGSQVGGHLEGLLHAASPPFPSTGGGGSGSGSGSSGSALPSAGSAGGAASSLTSSSSPSSPAPQPQEQSFAEKLAKVVTPVSES